MILHLVNDNKFIDMGLKKFESEHPNSNKAIIIGRKKRLRHVKSKLIEFVSAKQAIKLINSDEYSALVVHWLGKSAISLIENTPNKKNIAWIGWGSDYYERLLKEVYPNGLLLEKTQELTKNRLTIPKLSAKYLKSKIRNLLKIKSEPDTRTIGKINFFIPVLDTEYKLAKIHNEWLTASYTPWNYGILEDDFLPTDTPIRKNERNILIGNSSTPENNHIEIFENLKLNKEIDGRKIIVPLSYGDSWYQKKIIKIGRNIFGEDFLPLTSFMPKSDYINLLASCDHVFMNHLRQQALGNICIMLAIGAKVHLNKQSILYDWFKQKGVHVSPINFNNNSVIPNDEFLPLTAQQKNDNYKFLQSHWGRETQTKNTKKLVDLLIKPN
jgi:dTDP-N-acetylfucosamine:lipid II N-acetylfucosaminyltransferase